MKEGRAAIVSWLVREILPHEPLVRAWLRRSGFSTEDCEDLMQEAYCRFAGLSGVSHIHNPRGYFVQTVRGLIIDQVRRAKVVPIEAVGELRLLEVDSAIPGPDRAAYAKQQLARVQHVLSELPARCRTIFTLRKIEGLPQREIARRLGVTETIVENEVMRGLRSIAKAFGDPDASAEEAQGATRRPARA